jgi:hypothetical protein
MVIPFARSLTPQTARKTVCPKGCDKKRALAVLRSLAS